MEQDKTLSLEKEIKIAFKPATIYAGGYIVQNFLYLLSTLLIAKILDVNSFGLYSLGWAVVGIGATLSGLGFSMIPSKFVPFYQHEDKIGKLRDFLKFLFKCQIIASVSVTLLLILSSKFISINIYHKIGLPLFLILLSGLIPFQKLFELFGAVFRGFKKVNYAVYVQGFFEPSYRFLALLAVFLLGGSIKSVFFVLYSGVILALILFVTLYRKLIVKTFLDKPSPVLSCDRRDVMLYSLPLLGISIISYLMQRTDILMIGYFLSPDKIGIYNIAFKMSLVVALSLLALDSIFAPIISELYTKGDHKKLSLAYKSFTRIIIYVSAFTFSAILFLSKPILSVIGKDFLPGVYPLIILSVGQLINVSVGPAGSILTMTKYPRINLYNSIGLLSINIVLNLILIPRYGMLGAAIATSTSIILINLLRILEVYALFKIHPFSLSYLKPFASLVISLLAAAGAMHLTNITNNLILFGVFTLAYLVSVFVLGISQEERYMISLVKNYRIFAKKPDASSV